MGGLQGNELSVRIGAADANWSSCTTFSTYFENFNQSGGGKNIESVPVFGNAFVDKEEPREQVEVSFDAIFQYSAGVLLDQLVMGSSLDGSTAVESNQDPSSKVIYLYWTDGTNEYCRAYNNVQATNLLDVEQAADDFLRGTVNFKLSATDASGSSNIQVDDAHPSTLSW
jgi:hypothetical protein